MSAENTGVETTWGRPAVEYEPRAVRRYIALLDKLAVSGEIAGITLSVAFLGLLGWMIAYANFETAVFEDGTDARCIYDGETGEIRSVTE